MNKKSASDDIITILNISNTEFNNKLEKRIEIGQELFVRHVETNVELEKLRDDYNLWSDYNFELLKQVFNRQNNEYAESYINSGYTFMGQLGEVQNNPVATQRNLIQHKLNNLKSLLAKSELLKSEIITDVLSSSLQKSNSLTKREIFIVHGHDDLAKTKTARFIEKLGLTPIILHEQSNAGSTIIEKIEQYTNVGFGIILYTPCDVGSKKANENNLKNRARQNVVFEHGYLIGKIGRKNVCALVKGDIELPNDISGIVYIKMDDDEAWHLKIAKELQSSNYIVDLNHLL